MRVWRILLILSGMAIVMPVTCCTMNMADPIVGTWNRTDPPGSNSYVFDNDGTCHLLTGDRVILSGNWKRTADGEYDINFLGNIEHIKMNSERTRFKETYDYEKVRGKT